MLSKTDIKVREEKSCIAVEKYGDTLWHYTDWYALDGILQNKQIWFGCSSNMNDKKEISGFIDDLQ